MLKPPIPYFGGKRLITPTLMELIPPHKTYVEVFGGSGTLLLAKPVSDVEVYNDIDSRLVNFFKVMQNPETYAEFMHMLEWTPHSRELKYDAWENKDEGTAVERAHAYFVIITQGFSGKFEGSWGYVVGDKRHETVGRKERLRAFHRRIMVDEVRIENDTWQKIVDRYDRPETFFYMDPPYVASTRRSGKYAFEMSESEHIELVDRILELSGKVLLSGYAHEIYKPLVDAGWGVVEEEVPCSAAGRVKGSNLMGEGAVEREGQTRTETMWYNYDKPIQQMELF